MKEIKYVKGKFYRLHEWDLSLDSVIELSESSLDIIKRQLIQLYCNNCNVKSCQIDDPSNEGRIYQL